MAKNGSLSRAKKAKNDEFYTRLCDVENELRHYQQHFRDKVVLCNCDAPTWSAFWKYFHLNFTELGLKKLISTHYDREDSTYKMEYTGGDDNDTEVGVKTPLEGNGDFRNKECLDLLGECDIVVTNPPFSLFREYVATLMEHQKKFLIIGNKNAITYKKFFPLLKNNEVWLGCTNVKEFLQPDGSVKKFGNIGWFTNLDVKKRHEMLDLRGNYYSPEKYPKYDNYDAINVDKVADIPSDYYEAIGVPITYMDKYCPEQFEILNCNDFRVSEDVPQKPHGLIKDKEGTITLDKVSEENIIDQTDRQTDTHRLCSNAHQEDTMTWYQDQLLMVKKYIDEFLLDVNNCNSVCYVPVSQDNIDVVYQILCKVFNCKKEDLEYRLGVMGVPITYMDKYNPEQFEILGIANSARWIGYECYTLINDRKIYNRILMKKRS